MTALAGSQPTSTVSNWCLRFAGVSGLINGLGFGGFAIPAIWSIAVGRVVRYPGDLPGYGNGPFHRLGVPTTVPLLTAFVIACTVQVVGGVFLLWPRAPGILLSLIGILVCAPFWWGFDLPFTWLSMVEVITFILIGWTFRRPGQPESSQERRSMTALIDAELLKLSTRAHAGVFLVAMIFVPIAVSSEIPRPGKGGTALSIYDPDLLALAVGTGFVVPMVFVALLGGVAVTQEFRYGTVTSTYLTEPRRHRVLMAKIGALVVASLLTTAVTLSVAGPVAVALISTRGGHLHVGTRFWQTVAGCAIVMLLYAVVGALIGALVRNQVAFVVAALAWMLAVEHLLIPAHMSVGRWLPVAAAYQLMQLGPSVDPDGRLLPLTASGLLLTAYATIVVILAFALIPRRDIQ